MAYIEKDRCRVQAFRYPAGFPKVKILDDLGFAIEVHPGDYVVARHGRPPLSVYSDREFHERFEPDAEPDPSPPAAFPTLSRLPDAGYASCIFCSRVMIPGLLHVCVQTDRDVA